MHHGDDDDEINHKIGQIQIEDSRTLMSFVLLFRENNVDELSSVKLHLVKPLTMKKKVTIE